MSSPKVYINEGYKKKDGTCAVYILVHLDRESIKFPTGVSVSIDNWNRKKNRIKGSSKEAKDDNLIIERGLARMNDIFVRYRLQSEPITPEILRKEWKNPSRRVNFYAWMDETIRSRKGDLAESSLKQHSSLLEKMKKFRKSLSFSEIDAEFIDQFRRDLKVKRKNDLNTIHNNLKNLKAYLNIAIRQGIISENPFDRVKLKRSDPDRVFLIEEELQLLWKMYKRGSLPDTHHRVLRHFLFMCFTGLRISDLLVVEHDNIMNDQLVFFPVKTKGSKKKGVKVPLNKYALQLIADEGTTSGLLFHCDTEQRMNLKLKDISAAAKFPKKLSNHSGRHTFATNYIQKTNNVVALQQILGHSNISQTMVYVHITDEMMQESMREFERLLFKK